MIKRIKYLAITIILSLLFLAGCQETIFTVSFDANGGLFDDTETWEITCQKNEEITLPIPQRKGFVFKGWQDELTKTLHEEKITIYKSLLLKALWEEDQTYFTEGLIFSLENDCYTLTGYEGEDSKIVIPSVYQGKVVKAIGASAFEQSNFITEVKIPETLEVISARAFYGCDSLSEVIIPNSVETLEKEAFAFCEGITQITIPEKVKIIPNGLFANCTSLTNVFLPNGITIIENSAFINCLKLSNIVFLQI